ncbi:cyclic nucleotide-gated ion channel/potassium channel family protein [Ancylobacter sp. Lp-2]|uniref:cyclic nucleotide-gated ion channel n=1 Tax=Ancylobacter sp. Lp-2 TaxID=2881339 RepID=UPI001E4D6DAC|nr:cyclic nucleotide-gated ion channel [Ancylobacter sp. Lp-2]MCB4768375.1 cyclic nucleotide-gated ion channel/potassium channel family protein [Ancylobacter sp. Lp-2]
MASRRQHVRWWSSTRRRGVRRRLYELLEGSSSEDRVGRAVNGALVALVLGNVLAAVLETVPRLMLHDAVALRGFETFSLIAFALEYAVRLWIAPEDPRYRGLAHRIARWRYARTLPALVDLAAWLPFAVSALWGVDLRTLAILRLMRFVKLARYSPGMQSLFEVLRAERQSLLACLWLLVAAVLVAASAMYVAEGSVQPDRLGSIPLAMWWAIATVTTVGYGDVYPITAGGRVIAGLTMLTGIIMIALPVGIIATAFVDVIKRRDFVITWGMLARVPLFADLDAAAIGEIHKVLSAHTAQSGEIIVRRGEQARSMYFIASGEVELEFGDETAMLGRGQFFGEMALLHSTRRAATARARRRCMLLVLDADDLAEVIRHHPDIGQRIRSMAKEEEGPRSVTRRSDIAAGEVPDKDASA